MNEWCSDNSIGIELWTSDSTGAYTLKHEGIRIQLRNTISVVDGCALDGLILELLISIF